ncbi:aldo/keto reductase [Anaerotignum faecicola]|nr:aldo/keto reductase [Anaerotignum faecicola]
MEYRILGKTGLKASVVGIGGEGFENKSFPECEEIIDAAFSNGINIIDIYNSNPDVRSNVGTALKKYPRESYIIEGHLCSVWDNGQYRRSRNIDEVKEAFEDFLSRMRIGYVDIGMIHYVDDKKDFENVFNGEIIKYAKSLKEKGIIKHIGLSTHNPDIAFMAVESGIIEVILFSINPAYDMLPASEDIDFMFEESTYNGRTYEGIDPKRGKLYQTCENKGVALTVMKGYGAGILLNENQSPFKKALTPVQCIHYCLTRPAVASVLVGVSNVDEVLAATGYSNANDKEKDYSNVLSNAPKSVFKGYCMYCGHCAPCTRIIDIANVNKYLDLALVQNSVPDTLKNHYMLLEHHGGECIECGACVKNCPFGVDIIGKMKQAKELFGA